MQVQIKKRITTYYTYGHAYEIYIDTDRHFWGIAREDLGREIIDGLSGHRAESLKDCLEYCKADSYFRYYKAQGMSDMEIIELWIDERK